MTRTTKHIIKSPLLNTSCAYLNFKLIFCLILLVTLPSVSCDVQEKTNRLRVASPYGHLPGFRVDGLIAKSNDDLRQEVPLVAAAYKVKLIFMMEQNSRCHICVAVTPVDTLIPIPTCEIIFPLPAFIFSTLPSIPAHLFFFSFYCFYPSFCSPFISSSLQYL